MLSGNIFDLSEKISLKLKEKAWGEVKSLVQKYSVEKLAKILEQLNKEYWAVFFRLFPSEKALGVFQFVEPYVAQNLIKGLTDASIRKLLNEMSIDDRTAFFEELPGVLTRKLLRLLPQKEYANSLRLLGYPDESIGRMMTLDYISVRDRDTVKDTIKTIRKKSTKIELISVIYVTDEKKKILGIVRLKKIMASKDSSPIKEIMNQNYYSLSAHDDREKAIRHFQTYDLPALPVTDSKQVLIGMVTFDDVMDIAEEETTEDIHKTSAISPLDFKYHHSSVFSLFKKRVGWLLFLFFTAFSSSSIIAHFSEVLSAQIALTYFIPVLIGAGGNTGSQGATLVIRALAMGEISISTWFKTLMKEIKVGLLLSGLLSAFMFGLCLLFTQVLNLSIIVSLSMLVLVLWANIVGSMLPLLITKLKLDPAVVSNPFISTFVDAMGLTIYFLVALSILDV